MYSVTMFGWFDLLEGVSEAQFIAAYDGFGAHLREQGYVTDWRVMARSPHQGYDAEPPHQSHCVEITFPDRNHAERCYAYVAKDQEPLKSLHRAVNQIVRNPSFALYEIRQ